MKKQLTIAFMGILLSASAFAQVAGSEPVYVFHFEKFNCKPKPGVEATFDHVYASISGTIAQVGGKTTFTPSGNGIIQFDMESLAAAAGFKSFKVGLDAAYVETSDANGYKLVMENAPGEEYARLEIQSDANAPDGFSGFVVTGTDPQLDLDCVEGFNPI